MSKAQEKQLSEDANTVMKKASEILEQRGLTHCPARWTGEYFRSLVTDVIVNTLVATCAQLNFDAGRIEDIPQWVRDVSNEECALATADALLQDIRIHGA